MKPLDDLQKWLNRINEASSADILSEEEKCLWDALSPEQKTYHLEKLLTKPIVFEDPYIICNWYFRSKWMDALKTIHGAENISVLEVGAGCNDTLPQAMSQAFPHPETKYITANMNKELTSIFRQRTQSLPIQVDVIEDAAQNMKNYVDQTGLFDAVVFEHSVNDVIESMLGEKNQIDTTNNDWMQILPQMTAIVNTEYRNKTFEESVRLALLDLFATCMELLKPGAFIVINHYQFQYNLDIGIDPDLWENLLPIVRKWVNESNLGKEVFFEGFEPHWWMFIQKV